MQSPEMGSYGLVHANEGGIGGGIFQTDENMPPNYVSVYIQVDDLQAALDKAAEMGGASVMPPMEIAPGMGSVAMFNDPANNFMGLYSLPGEWDGEMPPKGSAPPVVHFEVGGEDGEALEKFYADMFGWQINGVGMPDGGDIPTRAGRGRRLWHRRRHIPAHGRHAAQRSGRRRCGRRPASVSR